MFEDTRLIGQFSIQSKSPIFSHADGVRCDISSAVISKDTSADGHFKSFFFRLVKAAEEKNREIMSHQ